MCLMIDLKKHPIHKNGVFSMAQSTPTINDGDAHRFLMAPHSTLELDAHFFLRTRTS